MLSLELARVAGPKDEQQEPQSDNSMLEAQLRLGSDLEPRDAFHPPSTTSQQAYGSTHMLEKGLPAEHRPLNFGIVVPGVYRSSFPQSEDYAFIEALNLKTMVTLVRKDFPQGYDAFLHRNGIKHAIFDMKGTKKEDIPVATMKAILRVVLDRRNHPLLIHCNHGKHRTGCVIGVVRKLSGWNLGSIIGEYRTFAEPKARECDIEYITRFQLGLVSNLFREPSSPPLRRASLRATSFARAAVFALVVLVVWLASGPTAVVVQDGVVAARGQESLRGGPVTGGTFA